MEGTIFSVFSWGGTWPPLSTINLLQVAVEGGSVSVLILPPGQVDVQIIGTRNDKIARLLSQPITLHLNHRYILEVTWRDRLVNLRINGRDISPSAVVASVLDLPGGEPLMGDMVSFAHPDAELLCRDSIQARSRYFANRDDSRKSPRTVKEVRRRKALTEQMNELRQSLGVLREGVQRASGGDLSLLAGIAAELRALVYAPPNYRNYNPLLLRLADHASLPLPVFVVPHSELPPISDGPAKWVTSGMLSITRTVPTQELIDLQSYLDQMLQEDLASALTGTSASERRRVTGAEVISAVATTSGAAHYDDDVPDFLDVLKSVHAWDQNLLTLFLINVSDVTAALAVYVLDRLETISE